MERCVRSNFRIPKIAKQPFRSPGPDITSSKSKKRLAKVTSETSTKKKKRDGKAGKENLNDSLCAICGAVFSNFNDGSEWEKCHTCAEWFHCCVDNSCPTCNV
ncbi:hypothetical protein pipiens_016625 [Culex pipiens pipiens]|uniref:RING-type domain-containing protein n=1 Tax=Culex pipiens pipiens TaxID=38569 RepID=A0ABD1CKF2_CULPP